MRIAVYSASLLLVNVATAVAQEAAASKPALLDIRLNVMAWSLLIFLIFMPLLKKVFLTPIIGSVEKREAALEEAIEGAKRDRAAAAKLLADQTSQTDVARNEAQRLIVEGRAAGEKMRHDLVEQARKEQQDVLARARQEIEREKERAIVELRREAVDLAIAGAGRVIEQNLDNAGNRKLVEAYLGSLGSSRVVS